ncbi:MAG: DUF86 domain-containing protein [Methanolobus sp.]|nr:HepT-like ribonuclease domain-containing protein [Methanolobus sp.]MDP2216301.1 DUF86 domain-containing protein [Methanolobus sp.]
MDETGSPFLQEGEVHRPEIYRSVFLILGKNGIIPPEFAEFFSQAAGFRNVLVHIYEDIDMSILYMFLTERLDDFDEFAGYIAQYLSSHP